MSDESNDIDRDECEQPERRPKLAAPETFEAMFAPMMARAAGAAKAHEAHRAACQEKLCARCDRFACRRCGAIVSVSQGLCEGCDRRESLADAHRSVPKRFQWALGADRARLLEMASRLTPVAVDSGLAWARSQRTQSLILRGDPGMGKTSLAVSLFGAWLYVHGDTSARFVEAFDLAQARARHPLGQGEAPAVTRAISAGLLVLDDLGSEDTQRASVIGDVLMARHNVELPTWVTSWLTADEMAKRYGAGVCRRVFEGAKVVAL